jgi:hypothetical protein
MITHAAAAAGIPADALVELTAGLVDEGRLIEDMDAALAEANVVIERRKAAGKLGGKCKITATIELEADPELEGHVVITYHVITKTPRNDRACLAKSAGGRLLCQADGARGETPDQLVLFDRRGRAIGAVDGATGEILKPPSDTLGKVAGGGR